MVSGISPKSGWTPPGKAESKSEEAESQKTVEVVNDDLISTQRLDRCGNAIIAMLCADHDVPVFFPSDDAIAKHSLIQKDWKDSFSDLTGLAKVMGQKHQFESEVIFEKWEDGEGLIGIFEKHIKHGSFVVMIQDELCSRYVLVDRISEDEESLQWVRYRDPMMGKIIVEDSDTFCSLVGNFCCKGELNKSKYEVALVINNHPKPSLPSFVARQTASSFVERSMVTPPVLQAQEEIEFPDDEDDESAIVISVQSPYSISGVAAPELLTYPLVPEKDLLEPKDEGESLPQFVNVKKTKKGKHLVGWEKRTSLMTPCFIMLGLDLAIPPKRIHEGLKKYMGESNTMHFVNLAHYFKQMGGKAFVEELEYKDLADLLEKLKNNLKNGTILLGFKLLPSGFLLDEVNEEGVLIRNPMQVSAMWIKREAFLSHLGHKDISNKIIQMIRMPK